MHCVSKCVILDSSRKQGVLNMVDTKQLRINIKGTRKLFSNDTGFTIMGANIESRDDDDSKSVPLNRYGNITVKGIFNFEDFEDGYVGVVVKNAETENYKDTYEFLGKQEVDISTPEKQMLYLKSVLTEYEFVTLYKSFSKDEPVVEMIREGKVDLTEMKGFGESRAQSIKEKIERDIDGFELISFLSPFGVKGKVINSLITEYGSGTSAIAVLKSNPYLLTRMKGYGFLKVDEIALKMGVKETSSHRVLSAMEYEMEQLAIQGDTWVKEMTFKTSLSQLLRRPIVELKEAYEEALESDNCNIIRIGRTITNRRTFEKELTIGELIRRMAKEENKLVDESLVSEWITKYEESNGINISDEQKELLHSMNARRVNVLIGDGGTGKSWIQNVAIQMFEDLNKSSYTLLAPTGRASKRMSEYTGLDASTMHRAVLSGMDAKDFVIIDETSMADVNIMYSTLLSAIDSNPNFRLLIVGDDFQLPSVGIGNILYDLIHSGFVKVNNFTNVYRNEDDGIRKLSHSIKYGDRFLAGNEDGLHKFGRDAVIHFPKNKNHFFKTGLAYYKRMAKQYGEENVGFLTPKNVGDIGVYRFNIEIQSIMNPPSSSKNELKISHPKTPFIIREGDLVMNTKNLYNKAVLGDDLPYLNTESIMSYIKTATKVGDIYNGDIGRVQEILQDDKGNKVVIIEFDGNRFAMKEEDVRKSIKHGWAITVHKSQGSQYAGVISMISPSDTYQLNANLVYTAWSRAEKFLVVVGDAKTINSSMKKRANMTRNTYLIEICKRLSEEGLAIKEKVAEDIYDKVIHILDDKDEIKAIVNKMTFNFGDDEEEEE